jgi:hypothetical protein
MAASFGPPQLLSVPIWLLIRSLETMSCLANITSGDISRRPSSIVLLFAQSLTYHVSRLQANYLSITGLFSIFLLSLPFFSLIVIFVM